MKKSYLIIASILQFFLWNENNSMTRFQNREQVNELQNETPETTQQIDITKIFKKTLKNGMQVLVRVVDTIPLVAIQMWYGIGSKDEESRFKGYAHLIEHMIFKGTEFLLSESDLNFLVQALSGSMNAFTSFDFTGYKFTLPTQNWKKILPLIKDCMLNVKFDDQKLNSEMKVVIQELKMGNDNNVRTLILDMLGAIFPDHPYHYPVIGYKQDLWLVTANDLRQFYKKYYVPNNATLIVIGDVNPEEVFALAEQTFGDIPSDPDFKRNATYHNKDLGSKGVTLYRDVKTPVVAAAYALPGLTSQNKHVGEILEWIFGKGKASRLYKKIVNQLQLAVSLQTMSLQLFDHSLFLILFEPKDSAFVDAIFAAIDEEVKDVIDHGLTEQELSRALKQAKMESYHMLEDIDAQAQTLGELFLATNNENYIFNYLEKPLEELQEDIINTLKNYVRPSVRHVGKILPLDESEKEQWKKLQEESDLLDAAFLSSRVRTQEVEPPVYALTVQPEKPLAFNYPKAKTFTLNNGIKILYYDTNNTPKIDLIVEFKTESYYDPEDKLGITNFVSELITEGTKNYTADELAEALESHGITLVTAPGKIVMSMPQEELEYGLTLLNEVVTNATFPEDQIEKVRSQILVAIQNFWDNPNSISNQLIKDSIYKGHPYHKNLLGTVDSIATITRDDLVDYYKKYITPHSTKIAIVGELSAYDLKKVFQKTLKNWSGQSVLPLMYSELHQTKKSEINYPMNKGQVTLAFARLSISRTDKDYDALSIFDQILGGGKLGSMASRLFALRERYDFFYSINESLTANATKEPGLFLIKTSVSLDRLQEAEQAIKNLLSTVVESVTPEEIEEAKRAIINASVNAFESSGGIAQQLLFLERYNFPADYFDKLPQTLEKISLDDVKQAVKKIIKADELLTVRVGRVEQVKE